MASNDSLHWPLVAESGPSKSTKPHRPNVRYWEKRTFMLGMKACLEFA